MRPYICISYASADQAAAKRLSYMLEQNGFACKSTDELAPDVERESLISAARMFIACTSLAAEKSDVIASDIRYAKAMEKDTLCVSLSQNKLDDRYCSGDSAVESIPFPEGEFPDRQSVMLFVHRAFIKRICKHFACFSPDDCAEDDVGEVIFRAVLAWKGDPESQYKLGLSYTYSDGVPAMDIEAAHWISVAANGGYIDAIIRLGELRLDGRGIERDTHEAYRLFTEAANLGSSAGYYYMGICCLHGYGTMRDSEMAVQYFEKAARQGYSPAAYRLARLHRDGTGTAKSALLAMKWFYIAASPELSAPIPGRHGYRKHKRYRCVSIRHMRQTRIGELLFGSRSGVSVMSWQNDPRHVKLVKSAFSVSHYKKIVLEEALVGRIGEEAVDMARCNRQKGYSERIWDPSMAACELGRLLESGSPSDGILPDGRAALYWYRRAMKNNHSDAYIYLAGCYRKGFGVLPDKTQAWKLFQRAATLGNERAQFYLGVCYERGEGVDMNSSEAVHWYEASAMNGYAPAQNNLGGCYENGIGVAQDILTAIDWYTRASLQGQPDATCRLGVCYELGRGVPQDAERAVSLYRDAASHRHPFAQYRLGVCYDRGFGVHQQFAKAAQLYEQAAKSGLSQAQYALSLCRKSGRGISRDDRAAFDLLLKAAKSTVSSDGQNSSVQATYEAGLCYLEGSSVVSNPQKAVSLFKRAVELYSIISRSPSLYREDCAPPPSALTAKEAAGEALSMLAYCELYGIGVEKRSQSAATEKAMSLFNAAAELGSSRALTSLGDIHHYGISGIKDIDEAKRYYRAAAQNGSAYAMYRLGMYEISEATVLSAAGIRSANDEYDIRHHYENAWQSLNAASRRGYPDATLTLAICTALGYGVEQSNVRAISLLERAESGGAGNAAPLLMGDVYMYGRGVDKNIEKALSYYKNATSDKQRTLFADRYAIREVINEIRSADRSSRAEALYRLAIFYSSESSEEYGGGEQVFMQYLGAAILEDHKSALDDLARMFSFKTDRHTYYAALDPEPDPSSFGMRSRAIMHAAAHEEDRARLAELDGAGATSVNEDGEVIMHELEADAERIPTPLPEFLRGDVVDTMRADALNYLGDCYFYGKNIEKDLNLAVKCYRRAAKSGSVWAKYSLGWCLLGGHGADKAPEEAVALFAAVSNKHPDAAYCLGRCYEEGVGVATSDLREALKYYKRAEKQGHAKATEKVSKTEEKLRELAVSAK